jgi:hypothetical protein
MESINIKIATLEKEYSDVLQQYQIAHSNYIANLNSSQNSKDRNFVVLPGRTFWGTSGLNEGKVSTASQCQSMCLSDTKCTGATFSAGKQYCWTRAGEAIVTPGSSTDYALIPQLMQSISVLKSLNNRLIEITDKINQNLRQIYPIAKNDIEEKTQKQKILNQEYANLLLQQMEIENAIEKYETIEQKFVNGELNVHRQNSLLKFWYLILVFLVVIFIIEFIGIAKNIKAIIMIIVFFTLFLMTGFQGTSGFTWLMLFILVIYLLILYP